ncbi:hypothetical protein ACLOJK_001140 [Asimina triloba]
MEVEPCVPPGFRFHPTEEELVGYYLTRKIASQKIDLGVITEVDLYRIEPWDLQERCKLGYEEQNEWYFFSHKDKKYPTGTRTNRATAAGFWKATGRDKAVLSKMKVIGMRKTLVFYKGRAPNGRKTDWIMHEYRLQSSEHAPPQGVFHDNGIGILVNEYVGGNTPIDEGWVVCRAFKKQSPYQKRPFDGWNPSNYYIRDHDDTGFQSLTDTITPNHVLDSFNSAHFAEQSYSGDQELGLKPNHFNHLIELPQLESPPLSTSLPTKEAFEASVAAANTDQSDPRHDNFAGSHELVDWKSLDKLFAAQLNDASSNSPQLIPFDYESDVGLNHGNRFVASFSNS